MTLNWREIWQRKGEAVTDDINWLDAWAENIPIDVEKVAKVIAKQLDIKPTDTVLDVGCGAGALGKHIAPLCKQYVGIDYTPSLVDKHIRLLHHTVMVSEANNIPFKDKLFDKTFSYSVFHYFPDKNYMHDVMREITRVTKDKIFIGDLPTKSPRPEHLLYERKEFKGKFSRGYWNPDRFNVLIGVVKRQL